MDGAELKEKRLAKGLSQQALAQKTGVSQHEISRIETGWKGYQPRETVAKKLSEALK